DRYSPGVGLHRRRTRGKGHTVAVPRLPLHYPSLPYSLHQTHRPPRLTTWKCRTLGRQSLLLPIRTTGEEGPDFETRYRPQKRSIRCDSMTTRGTTMARHWEI